MFEEREKYLASLRKKKKSMKKDDTPLA